jgi:signal recognition particle subunit SRP54
MSMIPGLGNAMMPPGQEKESQQKIKRYMTIMDSMTDQELDSPNIKMLMARALSLIHCSRWCQSFGV